MGTNYYLTNCEYCQQHGIKAEKQRNNHYYLDDNNVCEYCGNEYNKLHIGKSSSGWKFALHIIPEKGINTLDDWRNIWNDINVNIYNEYGESLTITELEYIITKRIVNKKCVNILNEYCVGHGEGTWDYFIGSFS